MEKCKHNKTYYIHNLTFETFVFLQKIIEKKINFKWLCIKKNIYSLDIVFGKKKIKLRCSYKLTLLPLDQAAKQLIGKTKLPFPYKILNQNMKKITKIKEQDFESKTEFEQFIKSNIRIINTHEYIKKYCINDAQITKEVVKKYWETLINIGIKFNTNNLTAGAISIKHLFKMTNNIKKKLTKKIENILRPYYFGGRTEVFGNPITGEKMLHYDWSGMYGQCMCENIPCGEYYITQYDIDLNKPGFYYIKYKQNLEIPVLPVKEDKLYFKNGEFEGLYWFEEIQLFVEMGGTVYQTKYGIIPQLYKKEIKNFVKTNQKLRDAGGVFKQIGKNNINTLYGRLGMRTESEVQEIFEENVKYIHKERVFNTELGTKIKKTNTPTNLAVAFSITSKARIKLYRGIVEVRKRHGRILYCDTDSIIAAFNKEEYKNVINKRMGEVIFDTSKEDTEIKDAVFCLPKTYGLVLESNKQIVKMKGLVRNTITFNKMKWFFYKNYKIEDTIKTQFIKRNWKIELKQSAIRVDLNTLNKRIWAEGRKTTNPIND